MHRRPLSIIEPCASSAVWQEPRDQSVWPEVPLHIGWQERKRAGAVASLGGSTMIKQARMLCRAGRPRRHGPWIGRRSPGGLKDKQLLSLRRELRSYRLNGSEMNKIVRSTSVTLCSIKRSAVELT